MINSPVLPTNELVRVMQISCPEQFRLGETAEPESFRLCVSEQKSLHTSMIEETHKLLEPP